MSPPWTIAGSPCAPDNPLSNVDQNTYLPTEEEIAAACREVQATWGPREERRRQ